VDRAEKKEAVAALREVFTKTGVVVVAHYSGLTVAQLQNLRKQARDAGATVQVAKNRLAKIALDGTDVASIAPLLKGPTLIAYSDDPIAAPKVAVAFAKDNDKFVILGGAMGPTALNADSVKSLATMPSLDELRAKLVGLIQAPATKIAQLSTAPGAAPIVMPFSSAIVFAEPGRAMRPSVPSQSSTSGRPLIGAKIFAGMPWMIAGVIVDHEFVMTWNVPPWRPFTASAPAASRSGISLPARSRGRLCTARRARRRCSSTA